MVGSLAARVGALAGAGLALLLCVPVPAMGIGNSITSPGAAVSLGMTEAQYSAYILDGIGQASMYANGASAAVGSVGVTSAATATGASTSIAGNVAGKLIVLLGGLAPWHFIAPDAGEPGLPPSSSGAITLTAQGYWSFESLGATSLNGGTGLWQWSGLKHVVRTGNSTTVNVKVYCKATDLTPVTAQQSQPNETGTVAAAWTGPDIVSRTATTGFGVAACPVGTYPQLARLMGNNAFDTPLYTWAHAPMPGEGVPDRHIEQTITCKDAAGQTQTVTNSTSAAPWSAGQVVEVAGLMCPSGTRAVGVEVVAKVNGGSDLAVVSEPYAEGSGLDAVSGGVPEVCYSGGSCTVELQRRVASGSSEYATVNPTDVPDWWTDPVRDSVYRCAYGVGTTWQVLPLASCSVYRTPDAPTLTPETPPAVDSSGDCSFGWADVFNGEIFIRGSKCVLMWAFVPSGGMQAEVQEFRDIWNGSPLGTYVNDVGGAGGMIGEVLDQQEAGCEGPVWTITLGGHEYAFRPLDACVAPWSGIAPMVKGFGTAFVYWVGLYAVTDPVLKALNIPRLPGRRVLLPGERRGE